MTRIETLTLLALQFCCAMRPAARADDYPSRPIHVLTTSSAGGISDIFMRVLGEELHKSWASRSIVENRPGGAGNIGARACQRCAAGRLHHLHHQCRSDDLQPVPVQEPAVRSRTSCTPITNLFHLIQVLVVNSDLKRQDGRRAGRAVEGEAGHAELSHRLGAAASLYMDRLKQEKGADWVRVPFKGGGEAVNAILGGSTPIAFIGARQRDLAYPRRHDDGAGAWSTTSARRSSRTCRRWTRLGYKGAPSRTWYGLFAPPGTPKPIVDKIAKEVDAHGQRSRPSGTNTSSAAARCLRSTRRSSSPTRSKPTARLHERS